MYDEDNDGGLRWWAEVGQWQESQENQESKQSKGKKEMGLILSAPESSGSKYSPAPAGAHPARCIAVIDLGTQTTTFQGETKQSRRVQLTWEIPGERMEDGRPFTISKKYRATLHERSTLSKDLEGWRNKTFTDAERKGWDSRKLLGQPCLLTVAQEEGRSGDGRIYSMVKTVSPMPKGMDVPQPENETLYFDLDDFDSETFQKLSKYVQETISASPEFQRAGVTAGAAMADEDIPF
jgi:hypothetical protein